MTRRRFAAQRLDGKVVVVTGSTQGLGAAIARARRAPRRGRRRRDCGRDRERGEAVRDELAALGTDALLRRRPTSRDARRTAAR